MMRAIHGCPNCGSSTRLLGMDEGTTVRKCGNCGTEVRHDTGGLPAGNHGYTMWDPNQLLAKEFGGSDFPHSPEDEAV